MIDLPKSGDEFKNKYDGKTRLVVRIDKRGKETNIIFKCLDCLESKREFPVSESQWKKDFGFGSWIKKV